MQSGSRCIPKADPWRACLHAGRSMLTERGRASGAEEMASAMMMGRPARAADPQTKMTVTARERRS